MSSKLHACSFRRRNFVARAFGHLEGGSLSIEERAWGKIEYEKCDSVVTRKTKTFWQA